MHARSAGPERRRDGVQSSLLFHPSPGLTPWSYGPIVDHGDGRIPAMHRAVQGSRQASSQASLRILHVPIHGYREGRSEPGKSTNDWRG